VHEATFEREVRQMWGRLIDAMRPMLAPHAVVAVEIRQSTGEEMGSMLGFDPDTKTWAVAVSAECDPEDEVKQSLFAAWGAQLYAALRLAMPATDNDSDELIDSDASDAILLHRLPRSAHPEMTDEWIAENPDW
jgi:hypothetical protein